MPFVLVTHPALPVKTVEDLVALARARPGQPAHIRTEAAKCGKVIRTIGIKPEA